MSRAKVEVISSAANPTLKALRVPLRRTTWPTADQGRVWVEGDHLIRAALQRGQALEMAVITEDSNA